MAWGERMMTDEQYQAQRQHIGEQAHAMRERADAYLDQELAKLFYQSGWTQERLAAKEGKSRRYVAYRLCFGRFLHFGTDCAKWRKPPKNLTEGRFRRYFEQTDKKAKEQIRFASVMSAMESDFVVSGGRWDLEISKRLLEKYADGKWHSVETMSKGINADPHELRVRLKNMQQYGSGGVFCESRKAGKGRQFRIVKGGKKKVIVEVLRKEAEPILKALEAEGKKNMATMSPPTVLTLVHQLKKLLDRLAK